MTGSWVCDACHSFNDARAGACYKCHVKRGRAVPQAIIAGAAPPHSVTAAVGGPAYVERAGSNLVLAVLVGAVATVASIAAWYWLEAGIHLFQGRLAWAIGLVIAIAVLTAGTLGGRRRVSFMIPVIAVVLTAIAVVVGEFLIISRELADASATVVPKGSIPVAPVQDVIDAIGSHLASDPLRPILWILAIGAAWLIPWGALVGSSGRAER